jgi:hypothetical protein
MKLEVQVKVNNLQEYQRRLTQLNRIVKSYLAWNRREIRKSITKTQTKYRKYYGAGGKIHWSSAPGMPPNNETGQLRKGIEYKMTGPATGSVGAWNVPYAADLEYGMNGAPRPFIKPVIDRTFPVLIKVIKQTMASDKKTAVNIAMWNESDN